MSYYRQPYPNELYHHGVQGMHWGVRRYQNPDGTLTAEGKRRYGVYVRKNDSAITRKVKSDFNSMSNKEFRNKYSVSKRTYSNRVKKYGDPYTNSPLARTGKVLNGQKVGRKTNQYSKPKTDRLLTSGPIKIMVDRLIIEKYGRTPIKSTTMLKSSPAALFVKSYLNNKKKSKVGNYDWFMSYHKPQKGASKSLFDISDPSVIEKNMDDASFRAMYGVSDSEYKRWKRNGIS